MKNFLSFALLITFSLPAFSQANPRYNRPDRPERPSGDRDLSQAVDRLQIDVDGLKADNIRLQQNMDELNREVRDSRRNNYPTIPSGPRTVSISCECTYNGSPAGNVLAEGVDLTTANANALEACRDQGGDYRSLAQVSCHVL